MTDVVSDNHAATGISLIDAARWIEKNPCRVTTTGSEVVIEVERPFEQLPPETYWVVIARAPTILKAVYMIVNS
jgi:hypothetical protein